jgi:hypothetical protein
MNLNAKFLFALLCLSLSVRSQEVSETPLVNKRGCGTNVPSPEWDAWFNKKVEAYKEKAALHKTEHVSITIPVVVHVIHAGSQVGIYPNLTAAQIRSQINVLNKDFAGIGYNAYQLANTGFSVVGAANTNITFCLAQYDPEGNPMAEPGIDRISYNAKGWTNPATPNTQSAFITLMDGTIKPNTIWDPTNYFNIWVSDAGPNTELLGYATFPGGTNLQGLSSNIGHGSSDGIWVWARAFGNTGVLQAPYNLGRTATHETGHWLGLRHIGGDGNGNPAGDCNATDYCDDTPAQKGGYASGSYGQNMGAPVYPLNANVCGSVHGDMFMNFMDYCNDASLYMFTPDQNIRMQTALQEGHFRNQLSTSAQTLCAGMPLAEIIQDSIACINSGLTPLNATLEGDAIPTYSWSVKPSQGVTFAPGSTNANPTINFPETGSYTITVVATNTIGVTSSTTSVRLEDCTGIKENNLFGAGISVVPNPSSGQVTLRTTAVQGEVLVVSVINAVGQTILVKTYNPAVSAEQQLDLSNCADGVYSLLITNGTDKAVKRLVLAR